jgi:hypothetical protein
MLVVSVSFLSSGRDADEGVRPGVFGGVLEQMHENFP